MTYDQERKGLLEFGKQKMLWLFRLHFITAQRARQGLLERNGFWTDQWQLIEKPGAVATGCYGQL
jgi:hypothetical protein